MSHPHHWRLDSHGFGVCSVPGCGEERQFTDNTWTVKQTDPLRRPREQVALVAQKLGRRAIGVDLSPQYTTLAVKRLEEVPLPMF